MCEASSFKSAAGVKTIHLSEAVGSVLAHDITEIRQGEFKGPAFRKGHINQGGGHMPLTAAQVRYIGLLGSRRKRALLFRMLEEEGFPKTSTNRIITPVGLDIGSITPEEIAISIVAQLIKERRENAGTDIGSPSCCGIVDENGTDKTAPSPV